MSMSAQINPADVLSREAGNDAVVAQRFSSGEWVQAGAVEPDRTRGFDFGYWWGGEPPAE